jgi:hypothetical protein
MDCFSSSDTLKATIFTGSSKKKEALRAVGSHSDGVEVTPARKTSISSFYASVD